MIRILACLSLLIFFPWTCGTARCGPQGSLSARRLAMITWRGETRAEKGFTDGLAQAGCAPTLVKHHADQNLARLHEVIKDLEQNAPNLIYVFGTTASREVLARITDIPVVFNIVTRPVESGIIADWKSSGNNATGVSSMVPILHQLKTLRKVIRFKRLGIIYNPREQNSIIQRDIVKTLEPVLGFIMVDLAVTETRVVPDMLESLDPLTDAVYLPSDSMVKSLGRTIMERVNRAGLPSLAALEAMVTDDGALMGLVPDYYQLGRIAAFKAVKVLQGTPPSEIPSSTLDHFAISVNMRTAKTIGFNIPTSILVMADRIIR